MKRSDTISELNQKLNAYKKKFFINRLIKGVLLLIGYGVSSVLLFSILEYLFYFPSGVRLSLLILFTLGFLFLFYRYLLNPVSGILHLKQGLSNEEAALQIGKYFPEINDKLLNIIELGGLSDRDNSLISASIDQKYKDIKIFKFRESIDIKNDNRKYFPYFIIPLAVLFIILLILPNLISEASYRIINFNDEFAKKAPFSFTLKNDTLIGFRGEDYTIRLELEGNKLPQQVYLNNGGTRLSMNKISNSDYAYTLKKLQNNGKVFFQAAGYNSKSYQIKVVERPSLSNLRIRLSYPDYTNLQDETIINSGRILVPEGTSSNWIVNSKNSNSVYLKTGIKDSVEMQRNSTQFSLNKNLDKSESYEVLLKNDHGFNNDRIIYNVEVIKDKFPEINTNQLIDSTFLEEILLTGDIADDYGFSRLRLNYKVFQDGKEIKAGSQAIDFKRNVLNQSIIYYLRVDSILQSNQQLLQYSIAVWDNDQVNGPKRSNSKTYTFKLPSEAEKKKIIQNVKKNEKNTFSKSIAESEELNKKLEKVNRLLKQKRNLNWEDRKELEEILKEAENFEEKVGKINELQKQLNQQKQKLENNSPELQQQAERLSENLENFSQDKEKEELLKKIRELLENQENQSDEFREPLSKLKQKQDYRERELKRLMELFKRLEVNYDLNQLSNELNKLGDEQKEKANEDTSLSEQQQLSNKFDSLQQELSNVKERNQELKSPNAIKDTQESENTINQKQQESENSIKEGDKSQTKKSQRKAAEELKKLSESLASMQSSMGMQQMQENIDNLRDIVDNLLKISFRQEELMDALRTVNASDPKFLEISDNQLKLDEDMQIVEDSLYALSERVVQIQSFLTEELSELKKQVNASIEYIKVRDVKRANASQQFAMKSMNNLSLMLDDVLQNMQMQMNSSQSQQGNNQQPSLSQMQQSLNQRTQKLSESQKQGRSYAEELAEIAEQQARIRKSLQEQNENSDNPLNKGDGGDLSRMIEEMEKIEEDLVNKKLNSGVLQRQKNLVTKLLESEKSKREQEEKNERKGETANQYEKTKPKAFEKYLQEKRKELELLQQVPPNFTPYFKNEINKFYKKLNTRKQTL